MLAPFTIVGPFAGVFLDRWQRRQVLAWGNAVRVVITLGMAVLMLSGGVSGWIYALGLAALSVNRFLLAGLSAGLPRVVDGPLLLTANSLTPTLGAGAAFVGGGIGVVLGLAFEPGRVKDSSALVCAALVFGVASSSRCASGARSSARSARRSPRSAPRSRGSRAVWPTAPGTSSRAARPGRRCSRWRRTASSTAWCSSRRSSSRATS